MISRILEVIPDGNMKYPLRYRRMLRLMHSRLDYLRFKFLSGGVVRTKGVNMLRTLLLNADLNEIDAYPDDASRYVNYIKFYKDQYDQMFDPVVSGAFKTNYFVKSVGAYAAIPEIILNVDVKDPVTDLPFGQEFDRWQEMRGIKIVYHDSLEIVEDMRSMIAVFKNDTPTFVCIALDVATLLFKYYKYWKNCQINGIKCDVDEFLKRYEYAHFFEDIFECWTMNVLKADLGNYEAPIEAKAKAVTVPQRVATDNVLLELFSGLDEYIDLVKNNNIKIGDFFATPWMVDGTYLDRIHLLQKTCVFSPRRNYRWCEGLLWLPYVELIARLMQIFPQSGVTNQLTTRCHDLYVRRFKYASMPNIQKGTEVKMFVEVIGDVLEECLKRRISQ